MRKRENSDVYVAGTIMKDRDSATTLPEEALDQAIAWHIKLSDAPSANDWALFTVWLETDITHNLAYDQVCDADFRLSEINGSRSVRNDNIVDNKDDPGTHRAWKLPAILISGLAAALLFVSFIWPQMSGSNLSTIVTKPGETRTIAIDSSTKIEMNGDTRLTVDDASPRFARLDKGEALFTVRHDMENPFIVQTGPYILKDVGTTFNVKRVGDRLNVSVAEGAIVLNPAQEAIQLGRGKFLSVTDGGQAVIGNVPEDVVGAWRARMLSYNDVSVTEIMNDITRRTGTSIDLDPSLGQKRFTGTIAVNEDQIILRNQLQELLGVQVKVTDGRWLVTP